ncbi:unnamed protein product [Amoebophrya sp. A25]|nr:unnamed protein product [Amoebophrya sp. A25]|eukprot:GSA25T00024976001.1
MVAVSKRGVLNNDWTGQCDNVESLANGDIVVHQSDIELSGEEVEEESEAAKKKKGMQNFRMKLQQSEAKRAEEERAKALSSAPRFLSFAEWRRQKMSYFRNAVNAMGGGGGMEDQLDKMKKGELQLNFDDIKQMMSRIGGKKDRFVMKFVMQEAEQAQMEFQQGNFVQRPAFQAMAAFLVSAQIFLVGYATEFISYSDPIDNRLLWAILDIALVLPFFLFEFSQRFKVLGFAYFDIYTHDFFFLMVGVFEASYPLWVGGEILKATKILQLGRIVNLSRLKDVIYQFPRIRKIVTEGMAAFDFATVFKAAMWCLLLITLMTYMWTLLVTSTLGQEVEETLKYRKTSGTDLRSYFGHVVWGFNSFLGLMSMEHNIIDRMARGTAEAHGMGIMIIFLFFIAFARFGMLNVLIAQICARAIITSAEQREFSDEISDKEHQIALAKLGAIFRSLDADESGTISRQELMEVCELEQVKIQLRIAQIEHDDVIELFELLGTIGEDGEETELGTEEFIGACMRLKGDGKSKDCFIVQLSVVQLTEKIDYLSRTTGRSLRCLDASRVLVDKMDQILKRLQRMVPHRPGVDRNVNTEEKLYVIPEYSTRGGVPYGFRKLASGQTRGYDRGFVPRRDEFQRLGGVHNQSHIKKHVDKAKAVLSKQMKAIGIQRSEHAEEIASALQSLTGSNAPASYLAEQQRKLSTPPKDPNIPDKPATPALSTHQGRRQLLRELSNDTKTFPRRWIWISCVRKRQGRNGGNRTIFKYS